MNYKKVVDIVGQIYESVAYDDVWEDVLTNISALLNSHFCYITITDRQSGQTNLISHFLNDHEKERYVDTLSSQDELSLASSHTPIGSLKKRIELIDHLNFKQSPFYLDFLKSKQAYHSLSTCFFRDNQFTANILFFRKENEPDFEEKDKKQLDVFIPHLTRAFNISAQTKLANLQVQVQSQIKDTTDAALFLVMENNISIPMNNRAFEVISQTKLLSLSHDRLLLNNSGINKRLQTLIKKCIATAQGKDLFPGGFIRVEQHLAENVEWHLSITPYRSGSAKSMLRAKGALVIARPASNDNHDKLDLVLSDFYGLTAAETQVLLKIISGLSTPEIANELNLTKECIRSRLKKIYEKTGASNQVQLTHNILEGPFRLAGMTGRS